MEFVFEQYLKFNQDYKGSPVYNELNWLASAVVAGVNSVNIEKNQGDNRTFILIHYLAVSTDGLGGTIIFTDDRYPANPLFRINNNISDTDIVKFPIIAKNNRFRLICSDNNILFSLAYTTVTQENQDKVK